MILLLCVAARNSDIGSFPAGSPAHLSNRSSVTLRKLPHNKRDDADFSLRGDVDLLWKISETNR